MTREQVFLALGQGKEVEYRAIPFRSDGWFKFTLEKGHIIKLDDTNFTDYDWRIKPEPPAKKRVQLGPEDVPPGSVIRHGRREWNWCLVLEADTQCIVANTRCPTVILYSFLFKDGYEISRDNGKTWEPCWKIENE